MFGTRLVVGTAGAALVVALGAGPAGAQGYRPPDCELETGHFAVKNAVTYVKKASEEKNTAKRIQLLQDSKRNLEEALARGETENAAVWYFLGRTYALLDQPFGTDSAFDRAARLAPTCVDDINVHRQLVWIPIINEAIDSLRIGAYASTKELLRKANAIYQKDNIGFYYLGRVFANEGESDSALYYFKTVVGMGPPEDTTRQENYDVSVFNTALLYSINQEYDSAAAWFKTYRKMFPEDPQALSALAEVYTFAGDQEQALVVYDSIVAHHGMMRAVDLLRAGETYFRVERLRDAEKAFQLALEKNQYSQPGLHNLASTYLAMASPDDVPAARRRELGRTMQQLSERLVQLHPQNGEALRLLAASLQLQNKQDSVQIVIRRADRLPFEILVDVQQSTQTGFNLQGRIRNNGKAAVQVPPVTFEFLDVQGNVVTTDSVQASAIAAGGAAEFSFRPGAENVVAWRYKVGSS